MSTSFHDFGAKLPGDLPKPTWKLGHPGEHSMRWVTCIVISFLIMLGRDVCRGAVKESAAEALGHIGQEAIPELIDLLRDKRPEVRLLALRGLAAAGSEAKPAVEFLDNSLTSPRTDEVLFALKVIREIGPAAATAVLTVGRLCSHESALVREAAVFSLGSMGPAARQSVPEVIARLKDPIPVVRRAAAASLPLIDSRPEISSALRSALQDSNREVRVFASESLARIGLPAVSELLEASVDRTPETRLLSVHAIGQIGPGIKFSNQDQAGRVFESLIQEKDAAIRRATVETIAKIRLATPKIRARLARIAVEDQRADLRRAAVLALASFGKPSIEVAVQLMTGENPEARPTGAEILALIGPEAIEVVADKLDHETVEVRMLAVRVLGEMGAAAAKTVPQIRALLNNPSSTVVIEAATAFGKIGPVAASAAQDLQQLIKARTDREVRVAAIIALGRVKSREPTTVSALTDLVRNEKDPLVRESAMLSLGHIQTTREESLQAIAEQLDDQNRDVCAAAVEALTRIGQPGAKAAITRFSSDRWQTREAAALVIAGTGWRLSPVVLSNLLVDPEVRVRVAVIETIGRGTPVSPGVIDTLAAKLSSRDAVEAKAARDALGRIGAPSVAALTKLLTTAGLAGERAAQALAQIGPAAFPAADELARSMAADDPFHRLAASQALAAIGSPAVSFLIKRLAHDDPFTRQHAAEALGRIGPKAYQAIPALLKVITEDAS